MKVIYKYELKMKEFQSVYLPKGAILRKVGKQQGRVCLWIEHDPIESEKELRYFEIFGTGIGMEEHDGVERTYIDTVFIGLYVWHVFERI